MEFFRRHKIDITILFVALILRGILFYVNFHAAGDDLITTIRGDDGYFELSRNLLDGQGFSWDNAPPYVPNPLRTPVYPGFIAGILFLFGSYWAVLIAQIILGASIPVLGRHLSLRLLGSEKIALAVGLMLAFEPYLILFSSIFYTETLFIFLFLIFLLLFFSYLEKGNVGTLALSAFILGLATLTKPTVQYLPVLLAPLIWWHFRETISARRFFLHTAVLLGIFLVILSPWIIRNYRLYGAPGLTSQAPANLILALVPSVLAIENNTSFVQEQASFATGPEIGGNFITLKNADHYTQKAIAVLKEHPRGLIISSGITVVTFFTHDGILTVLGHMGYEAPMRLSKPALSLLVTSPYELGRSIVEASKGPLILILIMRLIFILITLAFIVGLIYYIRKNGWNTTIILTSIIIAYFVLTSIIGGFAANARYRMPVDTFLFAFAALGVAVVYGSTRQINNIKK